MGTSYEFTDDQNQKLATVSDLAKALASFSFLAGVTMCSLFFCKAVQVAQELDAPPLPLLGILLALVIFVWIPVALFQVVTKFKLIIETEGRDIEHLLKSFELMTRALKHSTSLLWASLLIVSITAAMLIGGLG